MAVKFFKCAKCGKMVYELKGSKCPTMCCDEAMTELKAGTTEAATEKHIPVVETAGDTVKVTVGSVIHPMEEKHFIEWIALETEQGVAFKNLVPGAEPKAEFKLTAGDKVVETFAYCNLHSLWSSK